MTTTYEFVLRGEIGDHFGFLFEGMRLERVQGTTVLTGPVRDQASSTAGGVFVQVLLDHGFGAAGVAIDSAPTA
jgi:hypothetical protein